MKFYIYLLLIVLAQAGALYAYHKYSTAKTAELTLRVENAERETSSAKETLKGFKVDLDRSQTLYNNLSRSNQAIGAEVLGLKQQFRSSDLDATAKTNPKVVQDEVNSTINSSFDKLSESTRAKAPKLEAVTK